MFILKFFINNREVLFSALNYLLDYLDDGIKNNSNNPVDDNAEIVNLVEETK